MVIFNSHVQLAWVGLFHSNLIAMLAVKYHRILHFLDSQSWSRKIPLWTSHPI
jgi:hypothetical protein